MHDWGWTSFHFDWVVNPRMMIYCVAIAGIWQTSGFVMAMFLAGLRGIDGEILKAAQIDGASAFATYRRIIIPIMRPVFLSAIIVLAAYGDQVLRPRAVASPARTPAARPSCPRPSCIPTPSRATRWPSARPAP